MAAGIIAAVLFVLCICASWLIGFDPSLPGEFSRAELIPYVGLVALAIVLPVSAMRKAGLLSVPHPFVHASWTYLAPILVGGSMLFVMLGVSDVPPDLMRAIAADYRVTLVYLACGIAALALGSNLNPVRKTGVLAGRYLPQFEWSRRHTAIAGIVLMFGGVAVQFLNFYGGLIGYQLSAAGPFTALYYYIGLIFQFGIFLTWHAIFSATRPGWREVLLIGLIILAELVVAVLAGSRGLLFACWIIMVLACFTRFPRPSPRMLTGVALAGLVALSVGFTVGTLFRYVKSGILAPATTVQQPVAAATDSGPEEPVGQADSDAANAPSANPGPTPQRPANSAEHALNAQRNTSLQDQAANIRTAVSLSGSGQMPLIVRSFAARTNVLTHVAVLVSRRDELVASMPATLRSGILIGLATSLVPRVLWPDKPVIGDAAAHAKLFFEFEGNSFAVTPIGDLFLNYGSAGIVPGMVLLGMMIGFVHAALMQGPAIPAARGGIYAVLLTQFSMEGFYAYMLPSMLRAGLIAVAVALLADFVIRRIRQGPARTSPS
jgi:hypothetical protein